MQNKISENKLKTNGIILNTFYNMKVIYLYLEIYKQQITKNLDCNTRGNLDSITSNPRRRTTYNERQKHKNNIQFYIQRQESCK
jgi:hypothetical protein